MTASARWAKSSLADVLSEEGQPDLDRIIDVQVHERDRLPGAEREAAAEDGHARVRRDERRQDVRPAVSPGTVGVLPAVVGREQIAQRVEQVVVAAAPS